MALRIWGGCPCVAAFMLSRATQCHLDKWLEALALHVAGGDEVACPRSCDYGGTAPKPVVPQPRPCHLSRDDSGTQWDYP